MAGQVAAYLPTDGLRATEVVERVEQLTDLALGLPDSVPVVSVSKGVTARASDGRYATVQVLTAEARILGLAARGRHGGYGQVAYTAVMAAGRDGRLDPSQARAVLHLAGGGDFLSVLTAPAGAGKTSTLGAAARAWQQAGYQVVGLAPSARAAAELATATGEPTDTLAKWLHTHRKENLHAQLEMAVLADRTVVIVDEASMASTLDLDPLITAAGHAGAKVVLVGDPAQIGVVNGPGGMLAALAGAGHGVDLAEIHRFTEVWERRASLALRHGRLDALDAYASAGRLHPCQDGDDAVDAVFAHWAAARADGQDALMLARTRVDVDALNERARAAAVAAGEVIGPVTVAGGRQWQAGDMLRARRNDRRLSLGDSHVRNGDRFRVLGAGPQDGLIVEDVTGRGRAVLPADYLSKHADPQLHSHALVLNKVRCADGRWRTLDATELFHHKKSAGMVYQAALRNEMHERLGVRFREVNENGQADIAGVPDALLELWSKRTADVDAEAAPRIAEYEKLLGRTMTAAEREGVIKTAVLKTRARKQHPELSALHATWTAEAAQVGWTPERLRRSTGLRTGRARAEHGGRVSPSDSAGPAGLARPTRVVPSDPDRSSPQGTTASSPAEPALVGAAATAEEVAAEALAAGALLAAGARRAVFSRADVPRWAPRRRRSLTDVLVTGEQQLRQTDPTWGTLDAEINRLTDQVAHHTRQRQADDLAGQHLVRPNAWDRMRTGQPAWSGPDVLDARQLASMLVGREPYRGAEPDHSDGLRR